MCAAPVPESAAAGPVPPNLHWGLVLLLAIFTGVFGYVWFFIQASFVEKLDPSSRILRTLMYAAISWAVGTAAMIVPFFFIGLLSGMNRGDKSGFIALAIAVLVGILINMVHVVFFFQAAFQMRRVLVRHYNEVEPYGLRLGGAMTFFFNMLYFQYHFTRIAEWKQGRVAAPGLNG